MGTSVSTNNNTAEAGVDGIPGASTPDSCKDGSSTKSKESASSKFSNNDVCVNNMLKNMSTADNKDDNSADVREESFECGLCSWGQTKKMCISCEQKLQHATNDDDNDEERCANCGKEGSDNMNTCNKCKMVKYCNAVCKKVHKKKHKKDCEEYNRLAAERAAKLHDEKLFEQPPPKEDCPICFERLPTLIQGSKYQTCCGKVICSACVLAPVYDNHGNKVAEEKCPFCRTLRPTSDEEILKRIEKRVEIGDAQAIFGLGIHYRDGRFGFKQDYNKALELFHRAGELGDAIACTSIGALYNDGQGVKVDKKKAIHYYELAAMKGDEVSRFNLGIIEERKGNWDRALKHHMIAVRVGYSDSLNEIKKYYKYGFATKEDYTKALKAYQEYLAEIKSVQRDKAAAADERYRYY